MSTNLFEFNRDAMIETNPEKIANYLKNITETGSFVIGSIPIVGTVFTAINAALDYMLEK